MTLAENVPRGVRGEYYHQISLASDGKTIHRDNRQIGVVVNGARKTVTVGCSTVSFAAMERIYALMKRHQDAVSYVAQVAG